jgi:hypothetical protein
VAGITQQQDKIDLDTGDTKTVKGLLFQAVEGKVMILFLGTENRHPIQRVILGVCQ